MSIKNKKSSLIIVSILVVIATTGVAIAVYKSNRSETVATSDPLDTINYTEATETEKQETEANKEKVAAQTESQNNQSPSSSAQSSNKKTVTPVLTYVEQQDSENVEANGYIPGIIESGGTCTLTLSKGSVKITDSRTALDNVQDTSCGLMTIVRSKLSPGIWSATLNYSSAKYTGTSEAQNVRVN